MSGCRDCSRCTEPSGKSMIMGIPRLIIWVLTFWNIGLFQKNCPQCKHKLDLHQKRKDGSFAD